MSVNNKKDFDQIIKGNPHYETTYDYTTKKYTLQGNIKKVLELVNMLGNLLNIRVIVHSYEVTPY
jgi:hypothetical protein